MKKILNMMLILGLSILLTSCAFGADETTVTTETPVPVITDVFIDISSVAELQAIEMHKSYRLVANLDISSEEWMPIGSFTEPYLGIFDGNGYTISGLTILDRNDDFNGLFGYLSGEVRDLTLSDVNIDFQTNFLTYVGGISGFTDGNIINSEVEGDIDIVNIESNSYIGLLTGFSQAKIDSVTSVEDFEPNLIQDNIVNGNVSLNSAEIAYVGGMIGKTYNTNVDGNYAEVAVNVLANTENLPTYVGGFIGHNYGGILLAFPDEVDDPNIYIQNNISISQVTVTNTEANIYVGGFMAFNQKGYLLDNYSDSLVTIDGTKTVENTVRVAGFLAENFESQLENIVSISELNDSGFIGDYSSEIFISGDFSDFDLINIYILEINDDYPLLTDDNLTYLIESDLVDTDFYETNLSWTSSFYNLIINSIQE